MSNVIEPALIGVVSTFLTLLISLRIQHYFWGYKRMSELRLVAYKELNDLAAEFLTNQISRRDYRPSDQFFTALSVLTANIKTMFSENVFRAFKEFEEMIPNPGSTSKGTIEEYITARDKALRALYREAVVAKRFTTVKLKKA
ncbi:MAG: hypothetical protein K9N10_20550 [Deltaproteobacteria bacterium]|nr:hypothetical protein [Deltaproteobacteria bacterium]